MGLLIAYAAVLARGVALGARDGVVRLLLSHLAAATVFLGEDAPPLLPPRVPRMEAFFPEEQHYPSVSEWA